MVTLQMAQSMEKLYFWIVTNTTLIVLVVKSQPTCSCDDSIYKVWSTVNSLKRTFREEATQQCKSIVFTSWQNDLLKFKKYDD